MRDKKRAPKQETKREKILIPDLLTIDKSGKQFLLVDTIKWNDEDEDRIIIAIKDYLQFLSQCQIWATDETFAVSPTVYLQLFTVNVIECGKCLPLIYALLPDKQQTTRDFTR